MRNPRRSRVEAAFDPSVLPKSREFLGAFASRSGWDAAMAERLDAACEETLLTLIRQEEGEECRLRLVAYREGSGGVLEFVVASRDENVQIGLRSSATSPARRRPRRRCHSGCCADSRPPFAISSIVGWMS